MTNQPVHHVLYMFIKAGCPTEAQYWIRETLLRLYGSDFPATRIMARWPRGSR